MPYSEKYPLPMAKTLSLLNQQSPEIKAKIAEMAKTQHYIVIVEWLNDQGIDVTYNQVRHYIATHNITTRLQEIPPEKTYSAKVRTYIGLLLQYDDPTYTINNIRLHGPSWSVVSVEMRKAGLIERMRDYSPIRWRILASKAELREWMQKEAK